MTGTRTKTLDKSVYDFEIGVFLCNNGLYGGQGLWTYEDRLAVAKTGLRAWIFDAEQDFNNIDYVEEQIKAFKRLGTATSGSRRTCVSPASPLNCSTTGARATTSTTRINGWYFDDAAFYGPDLEIVDGRDRLQYQAERRGYFYTLDCRGSAAGGRKQGYKYTVYDELYSGVGSGQERRLRHCRSSRR